MRRRARPTPAATKGEAAGGGGRVSLGNCPENKQTYCLSCYFSFCLAVSRRGRWSHQRRSAGVGGQEGHTGGGRGGGRLVVTALVIHSLCPYALRQCDLRPCVLWPHPPWATALSAMDNPWPRLCRTIARDLVRLVHAQGRQPWPRLGRLWLSRP